jgi:hypothetical protein
LLSEVWAVEAEQQRLARDHAGWLEVRDESAREADRLNRNGYLIDAAPHDLDARHASRKADVVAREQERVSEEMSALQRTLEAYDSLTQEPVPAHAPPQPAQEAPEQAETAEARAMREMLERQAARAEAIRKETEERYRLREEELLRQMDAEVQRSMAQQAIYDHREAEKFASDQEWRIIEEMERLEAVREASLGRWGRIREWIADRLTPQRVEEREQELRREAETCLADSLEFQKQYFERQQAERNAGLEASVRERVIDAMDPQFQVLEQNRQRDLARAEVFCQEQDRRERVWLRDGQGIDRSFGITRTEQEQSVVPSHDPEQSPSEETERELQPGAAPHHKVSDRLQRVNTAKPVQIPRTAAERRAEDRPIRKAFNKSASPSQAPASPSQSRSVERETDSPSYDMGP